MSFVISKFPNRSRMGYGIPAGTIALITLIIPQERQLFQIDFSDEQICVLNIEEF